MILTFWEVWVKNKVWFSNISKIISFAHMFDLKQIFGIGFVKIDSGDRAGTGRLKYRNIFLKPLLLS